MESLPRVLSEWLDNCQSIDFFLFLLPLLPLLPPWCFMSTEPIRLISYERMEVGRGRCCTYRYTVTTRMTPALRLAAIRAILMFHSLWGTKSQDSAPTNHNLFEEKGEPKRNRAEALLLTSLTSYRWAKPAHKPASRIIYIYA